MASSSLSPSQRRFLQAVQQAAFANPFSPERRLLIERMAGSARDNPDVQLAKVNDQVDAVLEKIRRQRIPPQPASDRNLLQTAGLFSLYHRYVERFNRYIEAQWRSPQTLLSLPFADALLADLTALPLPEAIAARYVSLFFQLRRAFLFIDKRIQGHSPAIIKMRMELWNAVFTHQPVWYLSHLHDKLEDFSTLLLGETGTGKTAAAQAIGGAGWIPFDARRRTFTDNFVGLLVSVNLSQFPPDLIASELFGYRKGAFTGAIQNHDGILARTSRHGSVFLDEIGDVDPPTQVKLLKVLEERQFTPLGSHQAQRFQGRVIAATHRDIDQLRRQGLFRDDFYYRLCTHIIVVPSLRQRLQESPGELKIIIQSILLRILGEAPQDLANTVSERLSQSLPPGYAWPGNVREVEQAVRRVLLTGSYQGDRGVSQERDWLDQALEQSLSARDLICRYCLALYHKLGSYEAVARVTGLDRRTVKRHIETISR